MGSNRPKKFVNFWIFFLKFETDLTCAVIDFFVVLIKIYNCANFGAFRYFDTKCPIGMHWEIWPFDPHNFWTYGG